MNVSGCLGTSSQLWALRVILNTLENNSGNRKNLLEIWCLVGGKLAQAFLFPLHIFKDLISCENTCNVKLKSEKSGLGWLQDSGAGVVSFCPDQLLNYS